MIVLDPAAGGWTDEPTASAPIAASRRLGPGDLDPRGRLRRAALVRGVLAAAALTFELTGARALAHAYGVRPYLARLDLPRVAAPLPVGALLRVEVRLTLCRRARGRMQIRVVLDACPLGQGRATWEWRRGGRLASIPREARLAIASLAP